MVSDDKGQVSVYNEASFQISRLHNAWMLANTYSFKGDLVNWRWILHIIWRELSYDAFRLSDYKTYEEFSDNDTRFATFRRLDKKIALSLNLNKRDWAYAALSELEIFIRILQNDAKKGGFYTDSDEDSMRG